MRSFFCLIICSCFLLTHCQTQVPTAKRLIEQTPIISLIDSIQSPVLVKKEGTNKTWQPSFEFIDSIQVDRITYLSDGLKIKGFLVQPKAPGVYPCIIWNRGGIREFGAVNTTIAAAMLGKLAQAGFVVIASQYRGNGGSEGLEEYGNGDINDILNLTEVLKEIPSADAEKIGMFGGSRGGMATYMALPRTNKIKVAAVLGAPTDKWASIEDRPSLENLLHEHVPAYAANKAAELDKRSAVKWADQFSKEVPILIMHGNADWRVKSTQSIRLALELDKHRVPYRLMIFEGGDHGLREHRREFYATLISWFDKYLKSNAALPNMAYHGK